MKTYLQQGTDVHSGKFTSYSGPVYVGDWDDDARNGYGVETHPDGAKFEGQYAMNKRNGTIVISLTL